MNTRKSWDKNKVIIDNIFAYGVASDIANEDPKSKSVDECWHINDWPKWKDATQVELLSLENCKDLDQ